MRVVPDPRGHNTSKATHTLRNVGGVEARVVPSAHGQALLQHRERLVQHSHLNARHRYVIGSLCHCKAVGGVLRPGRHKDNENQRRKKATEYLIMSCDSNDC